MPSKNSIKQYQENGVYHIYNRGVDKRIIFQEDIDYKYFLHLFKVYLSDPEVIEETLTFDGFSIVRKNFFGKIDLLCYCLMPNHFHLIIKQIGDKDIPDFMKCIMTSYSMYFNRKYKRTGTLFQGRYKAILIKDDNYLLHLSRYIHLNPNELLKKGLSFLQEYEYSSYINYIGKRNTKWVKPKQILDYFEGNKQSDLIARDDYKNFVETYKHDSSGILGSLTLEERK